VAYDRPLGSRRSVYTELVKPTTPRPSRTDRGRRPVHPRTGPVPPEEREFVEDIGIYFESMGAPRMAGRIIGRLLVADPPEQSSAQLMRYLQSSKGSISMMTRYLIQLGLIDRVGIPGERIDHFRLRPDGFIHLTEARVSQSGEINAILERGLGLPTARSSEVRRRMAEIRDFYAYVENEIPALFERYVRQRKKLRP